MMPVPKRQDPPNLSVALAHARAGRRVFPCDPQSKRPAISKRAGGNGFKDATTDEAIIRGWWAQYPDAIVGMPTGQQTGVFVVDVDVKAGKQGEETLSQLEQTFGRLPDTIETLTATGGRHLYYKHPRDGRLVPNKASRLGQGAETWGANGYPEVPFERAPNGQLITPDVDIRGDGGYVILPGSRLLDGREYGWEGSSDPDEGAQLAEAPAWLLGLVVVDSPAPSAQGAATAQDPQAPIPSGARNDTLYRLACSLRAKGLTEAAIAAALQVENSARCQPPLDGSEVARIAASAASKPPGLSPAYAERAQQATQRRKRKADPQAKPDLRVVGGTAHKPEIQIRNGELPANTDEAARHLLAIGADIYQHGNRLVRVGRWEAAPGMVDRPVGAGVLVDLTPEYLVDLMTRVIRFVKYDKRAEDWLPIDCPTKLAKTLLARVGEWPFSHLLGFCDSPTLDRGGRVVSKPGYDRASGLYLSQPPQIAPMPAPIAREDREAAVNQLGELFSTFPFASPQDESAAMAMVLTALLRRVLPAAPICCISASTPGTGKSLLADCIAALVTGRRASVAAIGKDGEEFEKRLDAILLKGDAICCFDNVDRAVKSDVLCQVATQGHKSVRILAQSRIVEAPTNVCLLMTGNNLTLLGDLARRSLVTTLDAGLERPEERSFDRDAIEHVLANRSAGIHAALLLSKAYLDAGCPDVGVKPYGSFEIWDRMVRRPLIWAGWPDPLGAAEGMREQDFELTGMVDFLAAWEAVFGTERIHAADLLEKLHPASGEFSDRYRPLREAAELVFGAMHKLDAQGLGTRLRRWSGRIIGQRRLMRADRTARGYPWYVEPVGGAGHASAPSPTSSGAGM